MKKKIEKAPLVTSVASLIRTSPELTTLPPVERTKVRKEKLLSILDKSADRFLEKLEKDEIQILTTSDLERIVKLTLTLSGEPDGNIPATQLTESTETSIERTAVQLDPENPAVKDVFAMLYEGMNTENDID